MTEHTQMPLRLSILICSIMDIISPAGRLEGYGGLSALRFATVHLCSDFQGEASPKGTERRQGGRTGAARNPGSGQAVSFFSSQVWHQGKGDFFLGCLLMAEVSTPFVCLGKILIQVRGRCGFSSLMRGQGKGRALLGTNPGLSPGG